MPLVPLLLVMLVVRLSSMGRAEACRVLQQTAVSWTGLVMWWLLQEQAELCQPPLEMAGLLLPGPQIKQPILSNASPSCARS